jgi:hypothetical protein
MKIGGENRSEWIMERHWKKFAEEIKVSHPILKKRLLDFCLKEVSKIDNTYNLKQFNLTKNFEFTIPTMARFWRYKGIILRDSKS